MLYAITDSQLMAGEQLLIKSEAALKGGCAWLQYRDKSRYKNSNASSDKSRRLHEATALKKLCDTYKAKLIINDDLELALAVNAHGLHLGQGDGSLSAARLALGADAIIGSTCHDQLDLAIQALNEGASYVAFGRFFVSNTKPNARPAPLPLLGQAQNLGAPVIAIGGITKENCQKVIHAGATSIAVCHSLFACDDVETQARDFCRLIGA
jgi:thiamine-phosphate pyrophosphorylase